MSLSLFLTRVRFVAVCILIYAWFRVVSLSMFVVKDLEVSASNSPSSGFVCYACSATNETHSCETCVRMDGRIGDENVMKRLRRDVKNHLIHDATYINEYSPFVFYAYVSLIHTVVYKQEEVLYVGLHIPLAIFALWWLSSPLRTEGQQHQQPIVIAKKQQRFIQADPMFEDFDESTTPIITDLSPSPVKAKTKRVLIPFTSFHDLLPNRKID